MKVVLVHGIGRTRWSFLFLVRRLSAAGHNPEVFSYSAVSESHADILARLVARLQLLAGSGGEVGLVGHSFGGLLLREAVALVPELRVKHLVMLATPNRRPRLAGAYIRLPFRVVHGSCAHCLAAPAWFRALPTLAVPYTVVAGTGGWRGRLSPFKGEPNDGALAVSETMLTENDRPVLVPIIHTFIMNSRLVHRLIRERLAGVEEGAVRD